MSERCAFETYQFALLIVRNTFPESEFYGKWLAVNEAKGRGWWIPGGAVDEGESFEDAAKRECLEEAGIRVKLKGILRIEHSLLDGATDACRMRVIYYAEPESLEEAHRVKTIPDSESLEARWVMIDDLFVLAEQRPGLRGRDLIVWANYLENGGHVFPLAMFGEEGIIQDVGNESYMLKEGNESNNSKSVCHGDVNSARKAEREQFSRWAQSQGDPTMINKNK